MATKKDLLKLIRMNCSECMGGKRAVNGIWPVENPSDIESCTAPECVFFKYRSGHDPDKDKGRQERARLNFGHSSAGHARV